MDYTSPCADYYKRETLVDAYSVPIMPVGHPNTWEVLEDIRQRVVLPPKSKKDRQKEAGLGRPQENRFQSVSERTSTEKCKRCHGTEHNSRRCTNPPVVPDSSSQPISDQFSRKCSVCHQVRHNKQTCLTIQTDITGPSNPE